MRVKILPQGAHGGPALLLSSSRREVRLWDTAAMDGGPACSWDDCRGGHFNHAGTVVTAVGSRQCRCILERCSLLAGSGTSRVWGQQQVTWRLTAGHRVTIRLPVRLLCCLRTALFRSMTLV